MFYGEYSHTLDDKNRVIVPSKYREAADPAVEGEGFYITRGLDRCIFVYTPRRWREVEASIRSDSFSSERRQFSRLMFSRADRVIPDKQGRILIPERLKELAGLTRDVVFVGVSDRIEIWDCDSWASYESEHEQNFEETADKLYGM